MKIKAIIELKNITKNDLEILCAKEEIVGGWKAFVERELEIGLDDLLFDYCIGYEILEIEEDGDINGVDKSC